MIKSLSILLDFIFVGYLFAQTGTHQIQKEMFGNEYNSAAIYAELEKSTLQKSKSLTHTIFGFLPYWENANYKYINYHLLTHIALFDFAVDENGKISIPQNIFSNSWNTVVLNSHNNNVKVLMTATNFDSLQINKIIGDENSKNAFFSGVKTIINQYGLDGIIVDFEAPKFKDRGEPMNSFMNELNTFIKNENPDLEVAFASPAVNWGNRWNFKGLAESCDYLFMMGYDYYGKWSTNTGPTSPLKGASQNLQKSLDSFYSDVVKFYPEKLILGIPYYGLHFQSNSPNVGDAKNDSVISPRYRESVGVYLQYGENWYSAFEVPYTYWMQNNMWNQYFVDNDSSLSMKYDLAISRNLKGVGIWALGYDGSYNELWRLLENKFETTVSVKDNLSVPDNISLLQNYPNPFNPETKIEFSVLGEGLISIKIYNVLGQVIKSFESISYSNGSGSVVWDGKDLEGKRVSSGIYFYKLIFENISGSASSQFKKMVLVK